jgi:hypothetical protein
MVSVHLRSHLRRDPQLQTQERSRIAAVRVPDMRQGESSGMDVSQCKRFRVLAMSNCPRCKHWLYRSCETEKNRKDEENLIKTVEVFYVLHVSSQKLG